MEEGRAGRYRIRPKAGNGEIVAVGEAYDTLASAKEGCAAVQRAADAASVVEADSRRSWWWLPDPAGRAGIAPIHRGGLMYASLLDTSRKSPG